MRESVYLPPKIRISHPANRRPICWLCLAIADFGNIFSSLASNGKLSTLSGWQCMYIHIYVQGSGGVDGGVIEFLTASIQHYSQQIGSNNTFLGWWVAACSFAISCKGS